MLVTVAAATLWAATSTGAATGGTEQTYLVLFEQGASQQDAQTAVEQAGGRIISENLQVGLATVRSSSGDFAADVARSGAIYGAARNRPIGHVPGDAVRDPYAIVREPSEWRAAAGARRPRRAQRQPGGAIRRLQWDMRMIDATPAKSYRRQPGRRGVRVGIIDTGIDGSHPDIAPNFDRALSRNFTTDIPLIDGPCEDEPDRSCEDPAHVDEDGHGRTWPARSPRRSTVSASPASPRA